MPVFKNIVSFIFILVMTVFSETHITGDITGMTFESGGNPYVVEQDILIPAGSKAIIKNGCIFLFKPFTGLTVHGQLAVEGTQENPVIFSSISESKFNPESEQLPNPFDWNGILISRESGTVIFKNFKLQFSVYGIKSQNTNITLENGIFYQNGQFHFTINDKIQFVQDNIAYSYNGKPGPIKPSIVEHGEKSGPSKTRTIIRYTSLGLGIVGGIGGIVFGIKANNSYREWNDKTDSLDQKRYDDYERDFKFIRGIAIGSGVFSTIGFTAFGLTFAF
jgi:hypothetical protein